MICQYFVKLYSQWTSKIYVWWTFGRSLARRLASSDNPTGPTFAACGDAIARNVAFTAPLRAAVASRLELCGWTAPPSNCVLGMCWCCMCGSWALRTADCLSQG